MTLHHGPDHRLDDAKAMDVTEVIDRLGLPALVKNGWEFTGPCPVCGGVDRFSIHIRKKVFHCRKCDLTRDGADMIGLVRAVQNVDFPEALEFLCGPRQELDRAEQERRRRRREADDRKRARAEERQRRRAIAQAREVWGAGQPPIGTDVERYLAKRGLPGIIPRMSPCLRFHPALPYMEYQEGKWVEIDRRPAMLAALQAPDGRFTCVHRTWLDLTQSNGKAVIQRDGKPALDARGKPLKAKKTLGSTKGNVIRLITPAERWDTLIMGEGIETTLTAALASPVETAAYWAGVDLGNMAGCMRKIEGKRHSGLPDMADTRAFVPPPWIRRLIFIMDGDSEPKMTRAKLECGLKRAMAHIPGLKAQIVQAGAGVDLNDVLLASADAPETEDASCQSASK